MINCEVILILTWSSTCAITNSTDTGGFAITDNTKRYVPVVALSTQDNAKLLQQLKSGFKRTINWSKYHKIQKHIHKTNNLNHLVDPSFQGVKRLFALSFEDENGRASHSDYYLPKVEIKDYNVKVDGKNLFDQPINNDAKTYENIRKIALGQRDGYTTGCLLDYPYFKQNYKMIAIDLSKQHAADPRAIQQINFNTNLNRAGNTTTFFIIEEANKNVFGFWQGTVKVL